MKAQSPCPSCGSFTVHVCPGARWRTFRVGDAVQTRDGREAEIIRDDLRDLHNPLVAVVTDRDGTQWASSFGPQGQYSVNEKPEDLVPAPRKRTVWVMQWPETTYRQGRDVFTTSINPRHAETARADGAMACVRLEIEEGHYD